MVDMFGQRTEGTALVILGRKQSHCSVQAIRLPATDSKSSYAHNADWPGPIRSLRPMS
jgi:hypothetical protein